MIDYIKIKLIFVYLLIYLVNINIQFNHISFGNHSNQFVTALPYILPMTALSLPMVKMMKILNTEKDKDGMASITIVIVTSYIVFYTPHAALIFIRYEISF